MDCPELQVSGKDVWPSLGRSFIDVFSFSGEVVPLWVDEEALNKEMWSHPDLSLLERRDRTADSGVRCCDKDYSLS